MDVNIAKGKVKSLKIQFPNFSHIPQLFKGKYTICVVYINSYTSLIAEKCESKKKLGGRGKGRRIGHSCCCFPMQELK